MERILPTVVVGNKEVATVALQGTQRRKLVGHTQRCPLTSPRGGRVTGNCCVPILGKTLHSAFIERHLIHWKFISETEEVYQCRCLLLAEETKVMSPKAQGPLPPKTILLSNHAQHLRLMSPAFLALSASKRAVRQIRIYFIFF